MAANESPFSSPRSVTSARAAAASAAMSGDRSTLVTFAVGQDLLAAPVEAVERVLRWVQPSSVPNMPVWLDGVIHHRGRMVPVIDLRRRLGRESGPAVAQTRIVVFAAKNDWLAAIVDAVPDVITVDASSITPPPTLVRGLSGEYLLGLVTHNGRVVLVLDVGRLLSATEQLTLEALGDSVAEP